MKLPVTGQREQVSESGLLSEQMTGSVNDEYPAVIVQQANDSVDGRAITYFPNSIRKLLQKRRVPRPVGRAGDAR